LKNFPFALLTALLLCLCTAVANANVVIGGTRVIFPAQDGEVTVRLTNDNSTPALVEAWIDKGDEHSTPDNVDTPFLITPPLFRMNPHKDQSLRIIGTPASLPTDHESLFWLNVLEIPPKPSGAKVAGKNMLQFAIRSRLKLFYRPATLAGDPLKAPSQLTWKVVADGSGYALQVSNPTPYHVTIVEATLDAGAKSYVSSSGMVAPFAALRLTVKNLAKAPVAGTYLQYDVVDDYGATTLLKGSIGR
jgi:P pilus assembly chaperone PapD